MLCKKHILYTLLFPEIGDLQKLRRGKRMCFYAFCLQDAFLFYEVKENDVFQ